MVLPLVLEMVAFGMEVTATGQSLVGRSDTAAAVVFVFVVVVVVANAAVVTVHISRSLLLKRTFRLIALIKCMPLYFAAHYCVTSPSTEG